MAIIATIIISRRSASSAEPSEPMATDSPPSFGLAAEQAVPRVGRDVTLPPRESPSVGGVLIKSEAQEDGLGGHRGHEGHDGHRGHEGPHLVNAEAGSDNKLVIDESNEENASGGGSSNDLMKSESGERGGEQPPQSNKLESPFAAEHEEEEGKAAVNADRGGEGGEDERLEVS